MDNNFRIGTGIDSHRFADKFDSNKPLTLGGVTFPEAGKTFEANSDGDVILHALCNALLSTVGGKTLEEFSGEMCKSGITDSVKYIEKTFEIIREKYPDFQVVNVNVALECLKPKLAKRHDEVVASLAGILGIDEGRIGLNYTTGEGLTAVGRGEGVWCLCGVFVDLG